MEQTPTPSAVLAEYNISHAIDALVDALESLPATERETKTAVRDALACLGISEEFLKNATVV